MGARNAHHTSAANANVNAVSREACPGAVVTRRILAHTDPALG